MPSIYSADWRNELNAELAEKQPLLGPSSSITIAQANIGMFAGSYGSYSGTPISALVPGTVAGSLVEGAAGGHLVLGIRDNDANDSVSIVSYNETGVYSRLVAGFKASGLIDIFGQIKFPAAQQASADPNTLDDYEEGTWTPGLTFGGASTGIVYVNRIGRYTKIGRLVILEFDLSVSNKGTATGLALITGVPFMIVMVAGAAVGFYQSLAMPAGSTLYISSGTTSLVPRYGGIAVATQMNDTLFNATARMTGTFIHTV